MRRKGGMATFYARVALMVLCGFGIVASSRAIGRFSMKEERCQRHGS